MIIISAATLIGILVVLGYFAPKKSKKPAITYSYRNEYSGNDMARGKLSMEELNSPEAYDEESECFIFTRGRFELWIPRKQVEHIIYLLEENCCDGAGCSLNYTIHRSNIVKSKALLNSSSLKVLLDSSCDMSFVLPSGLTNSLGTCW